jgi:hypothetical protein
MCNAGAKGCLAIAIKYSQQRLAVGPTGESDKPIWDYQLQQNAIMPLLAKTICLQFGLNLTKDYYQNFYCNGIGKFFLIGFFRETYGACENVLHHQAIRVLERS